DRRRRGARDGRGAAALARVAGAIPRARNSAAFRPHAGALTMPSLASADRFAAWRCRARSREPAVQEPFAIVGAPAMVAVDPREPSLRRLGDEIIAPHVAAVPPSRLDPLGAVAQDPGVDMPRRRERRRLGQ